MALGFAILAVNSAKPYCKAFFPTDPEIWMPYVDPQTFPNWSIPIIGWLAPFLVGLVVVALKRRSVNKARAGYEQKVSVELEASGRDPSTESDGDAEASPAPQMYRKASQVTMSSQTTTADSEEVGSEFDPDETLANSHTAHVWHEIHTMALAMWQAVMVATFITSCLKQFAGRHRPDFINRLIRFADFNPYEWDMRNATEAARMMDVVCAAQADVPEVWDGFLSFPSGHASFAFAGWGIVVLLIGAGWRFRSRSGLAPALACAILLLFPAFIAVSRTRDNRHHWGDILAGSVIGMMSAALIFSIHYSFITSDPFNSRTEMSAERKLQGQRDEKILRRVMSIVRQESTTYERDTSVFLTAVDNATPAAAEGTDGATARGCVVPLEFSPKAAHSPAPRRASETTPVELMPPLTPDSAVSPRPVESSDSEAPCTA
eukprot:TRINITY_DN4234_c0_g2_i1.p1 TRINITY_DN4234_c0_g2~~TRINITY_DN4234_c0_g2_i1.p1  ORF type:complete len:488 (+),score=136.44 TRINITY_DN4234_c0_g2_i1:167-1465(+)